MRSFRSIVAHWRLKLAVEDRGARLEQIALSDRMAPNKPLARILHPAEARRLVFCTF